MVQREARRVKIWLSHPSARMDNTFFYLVDTGTLWVLYGKLTEEEARPLFAAAGKDLASVTDAAGAAAMIASHARATGASPEGQTALAACARYLGFTQTFAQALEGSRGVAGHWVVLMYRLKSGGMTLRPAFIRLDGAPAPMTPGEMLRMLLRMIGEDLHGPSSKLRARFKQNGGLQLAPALEAKLRSH